MRWHIEELPNQIQTMSARMRRRALEIADRLVRDGQEKSEAILSALEEARRLGGGESAVGTGGPGRRELHVVPVDDDWLLRSEEDDAHGERFDTRIEAIKLGRHLAREFGGNLYIHRTDGSFEEVRSYSRAKPPHIIALDSLLGLYIEQLRELYDAESRLIELVPEMIDVVSSVDLAEALRDFERQTEARRDSLDQVFDGLGESGIGESSSVMTGLVEEVEEIIGRAQKDAVRDAGLIAITQQIAHFGMAAYGTARTYAFEMGRDDDSEVLDDALDELEDFDEELTEIAEASVNLEARD